MKSARMNRKKKSGGDLTRAQRLVQKRMTELNDKLADKYRTVTPGRFWKEIEIDPELRSPEIRSIALAGFLHDEMERFIRKKLKSDSLKETQGNFLGESDYIQIGDKDQRLWVRKVDATHDELQTAFDKRTLNKKRADEAWTRDDEIWKRLKPCFLDDAGDIVKDRTLPEAIVIYRDRHDDADPFQL